MDGQVIINDNGGSWRGDRRKRLAAGSSVTVQRQEPPGTPQEMDNLKTPIVHVIRGHKGATLGTVQVTLASGGPLTLDSPNTVVINVDECADPGCSGSTRPIILVAENAAENGIPVVLITVGEKLKKPGAQYVYTPQNPGLLTSVTVDATSYNDPANPPTSVTITYNFKT